MASMILGELALGGVNPNFSGRQRKNQPAFAGVNRPESEHIPKERSIGFWILTVKEKMCAENHRAEYTREWSAALGRLLDFMIRAAR